jgi:hypothetical protein
VVDWLAEMGYYDIGVDTHPLREGVRDNTTITSPVVMGGGGAISTCALLLAKVWN